MPAGAASARVQLANGTGNSTVTCVCMQPGKPACARLKYSRLHAHCSVPPVPITSGTQLVAAVSLGASGCGHPALDIWLCMLPQTHVPTFAPCCRRLQHGFWAGASPTSLSRCPTTSAWPTCHLHFLATSRNQIPLAQCAFKAVTQMWQVSLPMCHDKLQPLRHLRVAAVMDFAQHFSTFPISSARFQLENFTLVNPCLVRAPGYVCTYMSYELETSPL